MRDEDFYQEIFFDFQIDEEKIQFYQLFEKIDSCSSVVIIDDVKLIFK